MIFRTATKADIAEIQIIRNSVKENILSNPDLVTDTDCLDYITKRGKGWVCEIENKVVGFSIVDLKENNVWALFVHPTYDKKGIGRQLHDKMLNWYFNQTDKSIWLSTTPNTRADLFYRKSGWIEIGVYGDGEIKFEMTFKRWINRNC